MTDFRPSGLGLDNSAYVRPLHSTPEGPYAVAITPGAAAPVPGWRHTTLRVAWLDAGASVGHDLGDEETIVVPLAGGFDVVIEDAAGARHEITLAGRESVFAGATDVAYAGRGSRVTVTNTAGIAGRVALAGGPAMRGKAPKPVRHITTDEVPVEHRGAGIASREVRAFGLPGVLDADSILVCEVLTPSGNWSSWPPHKHDTERPGLETELEEIYYFETRSTDPRGTDPVGYQRVYGSADRRVDILAEVRTGDVVLVPHGWHGPAIAAPDADLYYLNVMAGPGPERAWLICDDPAHAWVREGWASQSLDHRLAPSVERSHNRRREVT
ncbi:MAG: 5-deoxy-glucuronate isomerase [Dermatophilaceae bacterium]